MSWAEIKRSVNSNLDVPLNIAILAQSLQLSDADVSDQAVLQAEKLGKTGAMLEAVSQNTGVSLASKGTIIEIVNDTTTFAAVANNAVLLKVVVGSYALMNIIAGNSAAMTRINANANFRTAIAASRTAMAAITQNQIAMALIIASTNFKAALAASPLAVTTSSLTPPGTSYSPLVVTDKPGYVISGQLLGAYSANILGRNVIDGGAQTNLSINSTTPVSFGRFLSQVELSSAYTNNNYAAPCQITYIDCQKSVGAAPAQVIKSVQRGSAGFGSTNPVSISISPVDPQKCMVTVDGGGVRGSASSGSTPNTYFSSCTSLTDTVLTLSSAYSGSSSTGYAYFAVSWQIVEFY